ncbi:uncharacterized protein [Coffea arabica]|uniref:Retrotransposon gag domain-containing protein n=1 Tax=Coffea arabica TaxID=13443 RepID=A0A6P6X3G2_COFAR|nr:uncharacterized protein LOC113739236 [Coffea arabica]
MKSYDATTDLEDQLFAFLTYMRLQTAANAVRCKIFPMFLEGKAHKWFQGLPPRSIQSFTQLARLFSAQFVSSRAFSKNTAHLMTIHQSPEKSLREYMKLYTEFVEKSPKSVREMLDQAHEKANAEEVNRLKSAQERLRDARRRKSASLGEAQSSHARKITLDRQPRSGPWSGTSRPFEKERAWTSLTAPRAQVLAVMEREGLSRNPPQLLGDRSRRDRILYCAYHRDASHDTENCYHLKRDIEELIKRGHLKQFIQEGRADQRQGGNKREHASYPRD